MELKEKTLSSELKFIGRIIRVIHDKIELPDGNRSMRELVEHPGGVCVAAVNDNGEFLIVEQFRYAFKTELLEFPAGKLEPGEDPLEAAKRELIEETGYEADVMLSLGEVWPSVGYLTERIYLYYAPSTHFVGQKLDPQEFLNVKTYSYDQLMTMAHHNLINDGKTLALLLRMKPHLKD